MPIPFFNLHDQTAEEMAQELIRQIPAHTPEWRNPRPGDPGRTLIDLFAFMGDKLLYRVNLLPERQRLVFLRLLDIGLRPATPARGLIQLTHASPRDRLRADLPARSLVPGPVEFETTEDATILPLAGLAYIKRRTTAEERASVSGIQTSLNSVYEIDASEPYVTTPLFAGGRAESGGIDVIRDTVDGCLWFALAAAQPFDTPEDREAARQAAFARQGAGPVLVNLGVAPREEVAGDELDEDAPVPRAEEWIWQVAGPRPAPDGGPAYNTLAPAVLDTTRGFTVPGVLRLVLPDAGEIGLPENDPDIDVMAGVGDRPPRIDDPELGARLMGWLRLCPRDRAETLPLAWVGINVVGVEHRRSLRAIVVGQATGAADLTLQLPATSVDPASLAIEVQRADGLYEPWFRVDELAAAGRDDTVFRLDPEAGTITFGDGMRGKVPPAGARVRAALIRHGGGRAGNLPAGTLAAIAHPRLKASQPVAARGGEEAETLDAAERRIPARLRHADRAVTERDFRDLAFETPGVDLARVEVIPRFRPFQRLGNATGTVSVLVVPRPAALDPPNPRPDRGILTAVHDHLDARRLIGTELFVIGPEYRSLSLSAAVQVREGYAPDKVLAEVETALRAYLAPVAPGGRDGTGWPLGQTVRHLELEVVVARTAGVAAVYGLNLFEAAPAGWRLILPGAQGQAELALEPWMLPELLEVVLGTDPAGPATTIAAVLGPDRPISQPIPVVPELC